MVEAYTVDFNIVSSAAQTADIQSQGIQSAARGGFVTSRQANNIAEKAEKTNQKSIAQLIGIQFTLSVLLKSSQIFTNTLGALFTILGGFIDLTLAPPMPLFASVLQYLAGMFPAYNRFIQSTMSRAASGIMNIVDILTQLFGTVVGFLRGGGGESRGGGGGGMFSLATGLEGMGAALAGRGLAGALIPSQALTNTYVSSIASGITGKLAAFLKTGGLVGLVYQAVDITRTFEESGAIAGIVNAARAIISAIAAAIGTVAGTAIAGPLGGLVGGLAFGTAATAGFGQFMNPNQSLPRGPNLIPGTSREMAYEEDPDQSFLGGLAEVNVSFYNRNIRNILGGGNTA